MNIITRRQKDQVKIQAEAGEEFSVRLEFSERCRSEGILGDAEEAGYDLVEEHAFLPEGNIYILSRRH